MHFGFFFGGGGQNYTLYGIKHTRQTWFTEKIAKLKKIKSNRFTVILSYIFSSKFSFLSGIKDGRQVDKNDPLSQNVPPQAGWSLPRHAGVETTYQPAASSVAINNRRSFVDIS